MPLLRTLDRAGIESVSKLGEPKVSLAKLLYMSFEPSFENLKFTLSFIFSLIS